MHFFPTSFLTSIRCAAALELAVLEVLNIIIFFIHFVVHYIDHKLQLCWFHVGCYLSKLASQFLSGLGVLPVHKFSLIFLVTKWWSLPVLLKPPRFFIEFFNFLLTRIKLIWDLLPFMSNIKVHISPCFF